MRGIGSYLVIVDNGPAVGRQHEFIGDTGHPICGEKFELDGLLYVVADVRHDEDAEARTAMRYSFARVHLRLAEPPGRLVVRRDEDEPGVLPFTAPPAGARTASLLPPSLVAVLVVAGYAEQKIGYRVGSRRLAQLRCGRWLTVEPAALWRLSRRAKRFMLEAADFALELTDDELTWSSCAPSRPELRPWSALQDSVRAASPPARPRPPALRLVPGGPTP